MITGILIGLSAAILIFALLYFIIFRRQPNTKESIEQNIKEIMSTVVKDLVSTSREELGAEKKDISELINKDLKQNTDSFKEITQSLKQEIDKRQEEIRKLEEDRNKKYGEISQALVDYKQLTEELRGNTNELKRILANNQTRGQWGELQAEKILEHAGMIEGQHFVKQKQIADNTSLKPDFTVFLTNKMELYVDVKFPLQSLQLAIEADEKSQKDQHFKQFRNDLKARIVETGKYVIDKPQSVDYVILFVPSESVFSLINKYYSDIIDSCFSQKVILAGPYSFFAIVRTIQESYIHFYYEQNLQEILSHLKGLLKNFERFKGEFADVGSAIEATQKKFNQITHTRYKQIDLSTKKINEYQIGQGEDDSLLIEPTKEEVEKIL
ncbi:MAG: DNA recombination protein RmuC [Parcubacteria group bacterium ADurb.Bin326]|nr:MAG: DNA recombination protein RmuC [Parcubacteria group bacterium ADurb.Bin326]